MVLQHMHIIYFLNMLLELKCVSSETLLRYVVNPTNND